MTRWLQAAKQETGPRTKPTEPTKPTERASDGGTSATDKGVLSVSSVLSEGGQTAHAPPARAEGPDPDPDRFPYGTACDMGLFPRTWTGRIVSLAAWRELTDWERHGPRGRHWNAATGQWELPEAKSEGGKVPMTAKRDNVTP